MNKTERHLLLDFFASSALLELEMYGATPYSPAMVPPSAATDTITLIPALAETIKTFVILIITNAGPAIAFDGMDDDTDDDDDSSPPLFEDGPSTEQQKLNLHFVFTITAVRLLRDKPAATVQDIMDGIVTTCKCGSRVEWVEYTSAGLLSGVLGVK